MEYLIIGTIILLLLTTAFFKTPTGKGIWGEFQVKLVLGKNKKDEKYVINNLTIVVDGKSSQIDHLIISKTGILVIETKNYSGRIYGQENQKEWTQVLQYGKVKNKFYNPILQNRTHIYRLSQIVERKDIFTSLIVFPRAHLMTNTLTDVGYIKDIRRKYKSIKAEKLSTAELNKIYALLVGIKANPLISSKQHIDNINKMKKDLANNICPRCGYNLILRKGKYNEFYGCSGYPKCTFKKTN